MREIDRRVRFLQKRLDNIEVVDPKTVKKKEVSFAATVTVVDEEDIEATYKIVGEDEIDTPKKHISWKSPVAKALMGKKVGDTAVIKRPKGNMEVEVLKIEYI